MCESSKAEFVIFRSVNMVSDNDKCISITENILLI